MVRDNRPEQLGNWVRLFCDTDLQFGEKKKVGKKQIKTKKKEQNQKKKGLKKAVHHSHRVLSRVKSDRLLLGKKVMKLLSINLLARKIKNSKHSKLELCGEHNNRIKQSLKSFTMSEAKKAQGEAAPE